MESEVSEGHSKQVKVRSRCLTQKCLICHQGYSDSTSSNNVGKSTAEKRKLFELLSSLLRVKVKINSSQNGGLSWNFDIEELPFCQPCSSQTEELLHCQQQLEIIQNEMCSLVDRIRQVILESTDKDPTPIRKSKANAKSRDELFRAQIKPGCSLETKAALTRLIQQQNVNHRLIRMPRVSLTALTEMSIDNQVDRSTNFKYSPEIVKIEPVQSTDCFRDENNSDAFAEDWDTNFIEEQSSEEVNHAAGNTTTEAAAPSDDISLTVGHQPGKNPKVSASNKKPIKNKKIRIRDNSKRRPDLNLPCTWCDQLFRRTSILQRHSISIHPEQYFECPICAKPGRNRETLRRHQLTHRGTEEIEAVAVAATKTNSRNYLKSDNPVSLRTNILLLPTQSVRVHQCDLCGKVLTSSSKLNLHKQTHSSERNHACDLCEKTYKTRDDLKQHQNRVHVSDPNRYECASCLKTFQTKKSYVLHCRIHTGEKPYQCDYCGKAFNGGANYYRHRKLHQQTTEVHSCPYCLLVFRENRYLQVHLKGKHIQEFLNNF